MRAGTIVFADNVALADSIAARLMGFDPDRIPLIREAFRNHQFPLFDEDPAMARIVRNGSAIGPDEIQPVLQRAFLPPDGWLGHVERRA